MEYFLGIVGKYLSDNNRFGSSVDGKKFLEIFIR